MRTPAGPSVRIVSGMPSRGMAVVLPAAPGTNVAEPPATAEELSKLFALPTSSIAFSLSVIAFNTSSILFVLSLGAC